jgi:uncharacterized protein (TIGR00255 family)
MLKSMTGYGRNQEIINGYEITVEIRSVNHRYFEFSCRLPRNYGYVEEKLKSLVQSKASRGKIEVNVSIYNVEGKETEIEANKGVVEGYVKGLRDIKDEFSLIDDLSLSNISKLSDVFVIKKKTEDEDVMLELVLNVASVALEKFVQMRINEGNNMQLDITSRLDFILEKVKIVEECMESSVSIYKQKLYNKISEVVEQSNIDENRVLTEVAIICERIAVDEEVVRLRSHIEQFKELLLIDEAIARKLDFLLQEINRETNTIGSKSQDIKLSRIVVDVKAEIEKIREQIQNVE